MLNAALEYARQGIPVFPVIITPKDIGDRVKYVKSPLVTGGHNAGSTDVTKITEWWDKWPYAAIGARPIDFGAIVVDCDKLSQTDPQAQEFLAGLPTATRVTRTISGNDHRWYQCDIPFGNKTSIVPGVDIRSANGYVVLPPSTGYSWEKDGELVPFPESYVALLRLAKTKTSPKHDGDDSAYNIDRGKRYLQWTSGAIEGQGGDHHTFTVACELVRNIGLSEDMAHQLMLEYWNERCEPPWSDDELRTKIWNACEYGRDQAGWNYTSGSAVPSWGIAETDFTMGGWLRRDIAPKSQLIGPINHDSRVLLLAPTGLGKTHFAMAIAGHLAAKQDFLHWKVPEAKRVLIIDGEMPLSLLQERFRSLHRQLNGSFESFNRVVLLSMHDFVDTHPMDDLRGQQWVKAMIDLYKPDLIVFDNIQALTAGEMRETDSWRAMLPWIRQMSRQEIAQIWVHHTNQDGKAYGDKTRSFQLDTEIILSEPADDIHGAGLAFDLSFGKHRELTPHNNEDYQVGRVKLYQDKWEFIQSGDIKARLVREALEGQSEFGIKTDELAEIIAENTGKPFKAMREMLRRECRKGNQEILDLRVPSTIGTDKWLWRV